MHVQRNIWCHFNWKMSKNSIDLICFVNFLICNQLHLVPDHCIVDVNRKNLIFFFGLCLAAQPISLKPSSLDREFHLARTAPVCQALPRYVTRYLSNNVCPRNEPISQAVFWLTGLWDYQVRLVFWFFSNDPIFFHPFDRGVNFNHGLFW